MTALLATTTLPFAGMGQKAKLGWQEPPERDDQRKLEIQVLTKSLTILNADIKYFLKDH